MRAPLLLAALLASGAAITAPAAGTAAVPVREASAIAQRQVVGRLATLIEARYLDPTIGGRYARRLRDRIAGGAYDGLSDPAELGRRITDDLRAVWPDRHLKVAPLSAFDCPPVESLPHGFGVFLPVGRTYDPETGLDWEGRGVTPDVPIAADAALDEALTRIAHSGATPSA